MAGAGAKGAVRGCGLQDCLEAAAGWIWQPACHSKLPALASARLGGACHVERGSPGQGSPESSATEGSPGRRAPDAMMTSVSSVLNTRSNVIQLIQ
jgi:hypothetical protein